MWYLVESSEITNIKGNSYFLYWGKILFRAVFSSMKWEKKIHNLTLWIKNLSYTTNYFSNDMEKIYLTKMYNSKKEYLGRKTQYNFKFLESEEFSSAFWKVFCWWLVLWNWNIQIRFSGTEHKNIYIMTKKIIIIHISAFTNIVCVVHKISVGILVPENPNIYWVFDSGWNQIQIS